MLFNISISELNNNLSNRKIIDIRSVEKYNDNHIPGAKNIPLELLLEAPDKYLNNYRKYYIYCQKGIKSRYVCEKLFDLGYNVVNIDGGYEEWLLEK